jgi:hypothetical protein
MGRSPNYLQRITEVAKSVVQGEGLSEKAQGAMQRDLAAFEQWRLALDGNARSSAPSGISQGKKSAVQSDRENEME